MRCWLSHGTRATTYVSLNQDQLLSLMNWHCVHQKWHSHFNWCCHCRPNMCGFTFPILNNSKICCLQWSSNQRKELLKQYPIDQFLLLAIEVFGCLHKQVNVFLHNCANAIWNFKGTEGPLLSIYLGFLFLSKISITLQRMQTSSILSRVIMISLIISWLPPLHDTP